MCVVDAAVWHVEGARLCSRLNGLARLSMIATRIQKLCQTCSARVCVCLRQHQQSTLTTCYMIDIDTETRRHSPNTHTYTHTNTHTRTRVLRLSLVLTLAFTTLDSTTSYQRSDRSLCVFQDTHPSHPDNLPTPHVGTPLPYPSRRGVRPIP